jgi:peptidase E
MRQIIAMGGGGFSMEPDNLALDRYVMAQTGKDRPKVCFLPTASGDATEYMLNFYKSMAELDVRASALSLFYPHTTDLEGFMLEQDVIYVGGGNTRNMLAVWREWGMDKILKNALENGVVLAGISAGAMCWFEEGVTDSAGPLAPMTCLGFLNGGCTPHYDGEADRRPALHKLIMEERMRSCYAADDGAALHFIDGECHLVVTSCPNANAYLVEKINGVVQETPLAKRYLNAD